HAPGAPPVTPTRPNESPRLPARRLNNMAVAHLPCPAANGHPAYDQFVTRHGSRQVVAPLVVECRHTEFSPTVPFDPARGEPPFKLFPGRGRPVAGTGPSTATGDEHGIHPDSARSAAAHGALPDDPPRLCLARDQRQGLLPGRGGGPLPRPGRGLVRAGVAARGDPR